jgi:hypothetical protein
MTAVNHELMHAVGTEPAWSESYYFNFVDPISKIGMFTRMGFRPGDGWVDALHVIYLEGSQVAFTYGRRNIEANLSTYDGDLKSGDLKISCIEPHQRWHIDYDGPAQHIGDATILLERSKLRPEGWFEKEKLCMSLTFDCITEPHYSRSEEGSTGAFGHFEQSGKVTGEIRLGDHSWEISGYGVRDKSWGPRDWGAGQREDKAIAAPIIKPTYSSGENPNPFVNWFSMNFGADSALGGSCFRHANGDIRGGGWIQQNGKSMRLDDVLITTQYEPGSIIHKWVNLTGKIADGTPTGTPIEIKGRVLNVCPTKVPMPGGATFINEGLTEFHWDGKTGYGISEHWHAVIKS